MEQKINGITRSSVQITAKRIYDDGSEGGSSIMSGCLWIHDEKSYIITNWHNVTGINPETDENMGSFCPNQFVVSLKYHMPTETEGLNHVVDGKRTVNLYNDALDKNWLEHPIGKGVDVVALPVDLGVPDEAIISYINEQNYELDWLPDVGDDCFIIGHPEGFAGPLETPVWKRGSVASLPLLDFNEKPVFLLDTIGNRGLSGAAVVGRGTGIFNKNSGASLSPDAIIGTWYNFVGIYAGRISDSGIGSQLGRVWKRSVIEEIFEHNS